MEAELRALQEQVRQLQAQTRQQAAVIEQMNMGGIPIPSAAPSDLDWFTVQQKHKMAMRMLSQASQEANTGLELLIKNAPVLNEVALLLRDLGRISDDRSR
jgi:multidrug resistance efflux pump